MGTLLYFVSRGGQLFATEPPGIPAVPTRLVPTENPVIEGGSSRVLVVVLCALPIARLLAEKALRSLQIGEIPV
jgi:hypothetical protein